MVGACLYLVCSAPFAAAGWTNSGQITALNQQPTSGVGAALVFVETQITANPSDPAACFVRTGFYLSVNDGRQQRLFAMLLAAQIASRSVRLYTTGACHFWGYAEIDGAILE